MTTRTRLLAITVSFLPFLSTALLAGGGEPVKAAPANGSAVAPLSDERAGKEVDLAKIAHSPQDGSPYLGPQEAFVVVNVFTDFQCPVCRRAADPIKQLVVDFPEKVKVVFRNNALAMHPRSVGAALAALAAGRQAKFWQYYDRLFANPRSLDDASLRQIATDLGLDVEQWQRDVADPKNVERVRRESAAAVELGVPGTPGIFVNGFRQIGWGSYLDLHNTVGREIAAAETLAAAGTRLADIPAARIRAMAEKNSKRDGEEAVNVDAWVKTLLAN